MALAALMIMIQPSAKPWLSEDHEWMKSIMIVANKPASEIMIPNFELEVSVELEFQVLWKRRDSDAAAGANLKHLITWTVSSLRPVSPSHHLDSCQPTTRRDIVLGLTYDMVLIMIPMWRTTSW
jgi:hypothetical protein